MGYLDSVMEVASNSPSEEDKATLRRLASVAGSTNYEAPTTASTASPQVPNYKVEVPPPSATATRLADIANQQSNLDNPPAHGLRRVLGDIAGVGMGLLHGNPELGTKVAEDIKSQPYNKQYNSLAQKAAPLEPVLKEEQNRTTEANALQKTAIAAGQGQEKIDVSGQKAAEDKRNHDLVAAAKAEADDWKSKHATVTEQLRQLAIENAALKAERDDTTKKAEGQANRNTRTTDAHIEADAANARKDTLPTYKLTDAASLYSDVSKETDPNVRRDMIDRSDATPEIKSAAEGLLRRDGIALGNKATPQEIQSSDAAVTTATSINKVKEFLKKVDVKGHTGPVAGRIEKGKLFIGNSSYDMSELSTLLGTLIPATETANLAGGRTTGLLFDKIKKGSGDISQNELTQLPGALDAMYDFVQQRSRGRVPKREDIKPKYTFTPLK